MKKKASEVQRDDVIVDRLGFLRIVISVVTMPVRLVVGLVSILRYKDGREYYDPDHEVNVMDDERR
jgi:hypothetical protein